jgi:hypothetical protein
MTRRAVHPGTPFKEIFTSKFVNELTRIPSPSNFVPSIQGSPDDVRIMGQLETGDQVIEPYEPVLIWKPAFTFDTNNATLPQETQNVPTAYVNKLSEYNSITHGWLPHWGIALGLITSTQAAPVLLSGVNFLKISGTTPSANLATYRGIDIVNGVMTYDLFGRAEIIGNLDPAKSHVMVSLTRRLRTTVCGRSINAIGTTSSGPFNLQVPSGGGWNSTSVQLIGYNRSTTIAVGSNKNLVAVEGDGRWVIVFAEC